MKKKFLSALLILTCVSSANLFGQTLKSSFFRYNDVQTGFSAETWSYGEERISEYVIPLTVIVPISQKFTLYAATNSAYANLTSASKNLYGVTDTRISGSYVTMDNHLLVTGGVTIPTGKLQLDPGQNMVASALAEYPLNFRVPSFGQGLTVNFSGVYAFQAGNYILGAGAAFVYMDGFKIYSGSDLKYKPGPQISINAGAETNAKSRGDTKFTVDVTYTLYGTDKLGGSPYLKSGSKLLIDARALFAFNKTDIMIYARERTKGKNENAGVPEDFNSNGNKIEAGGISFTPTSDKFGFKGVIDLKYYSPNQKEMDGAMIGGLGAGFSYSPTRSFTFDLLIKYSIGNLKNKGETTNITGMELNGGLKFRI